MPTQFRLLLGSSVASAIGGVAASALGLTGWPEADTTGAPGPVAALLVFTGFVSLVVGVYGTVTWFALSRPQPWLRYVALADGYAMAGKMEYARTFYEEALRWGADPEDVESRIAACEARILRSATHREPL